MSETPEPHSADQPAAPAGPLTYEDVGAILQIHRRSVERLVHDGELRTVRFLRMIRIRRQDVAALIEAHLDPSPAQDGVSS